LNKKDKRVSFDQAILIFLRMPQPGKVKTRLAAHIGDHPAAALYRLFITDILETVKLLQLPVYLCFYPNGQKDSLCSWLGNRHTYWEQSGEDLGERMKNAFFRAFNSGIRQAILIGTDTPDLPITILRESFNALAAHDLVIGPSLDGGYYLIGFNANKFLPQVFSRISWGEGDVFHRTMAIISGRAASSYQLPIWQDIDNYDDLMAFAKRAVGQTEAGRLSAAGVAALIRNGSIPPGDS
jgi:uncharacterized protein